MFSELISHYRRILLSPFSSDDCIIGQFIGLIVTPVVFSGLAVGFFILAAIYLLAFIIQLLRALLLFELHIKNQIEMTVTCGALVIASLTIAATLSSAYAIGLITRSIMCFIERKDSCDEIDDANKNGLDSIAAVFINPRKSS
ncbi:MAG: hypothetical protein A3E88_05495 [Legionellales bacterium RIFCSPHIGHO2_12_FULL_35_11]|nr:MAG: hypothetical protein A3E88_05495 [Legionellales bacterium RIFCSPHIGHO2_12_FULL_35_11]